MILDSLYIAYWSLGDPLCQSQVLPVLRALAHDGYRMGLMTFEQRPWLLEQSEQERARNLLRAEGIDWLPLRYHRRPRIASTLADILAGSTRARFKGARLFHGRGSVAAAVAYLASRAASVRFLNDADGPLSEEYVDAAVWRRHSVGHRLVGRAEARILQAADATAVLTEARAQQLERPGFRPVVLPCGVDTAVFQPFPGEVQRIRADLGLPGRLFVYAGKTGGCYLVEPMMDFVAAYRSTVEEVSLLVLTTGPSAAFEDLARARRIPCIVRSASREAMPGYLSACDAGLSFRLSAPSQRAASPVKNGEYLACGLPVVTTAGIGDYSALIHSSRVGVVVESFEDPALRDSARRLHALLREDALPARCRNTAVEHVGLAEVVIPRYRELYLRLLGPTTGRS